MTRLSLRWLILLPLLSTIAGGFLAFAFFIDHSERGTRLEEIDQELVRAERVGIGGSEDNPREGPGPPTGGTAQAVAEGAPVHLVLTTDGTVAGATGTPSVFDPDTLALLGSTRDRTFTDADGHRLLVSPLPNGRVRVTALPLSGLQSATETLRRNLVLGGVVITVLASATAWWLAGRLVRPLTAIAAAADRIADGDLDTSLEHARGSREVADLSRDLQRMVARLREALADRESSERAATQARDDMRRLLADVSHEIRTPLTALHGYSDLYAQGMLTEPAALDRAMARVGSESKRLHSLVDSMLRLARGDRTRPPVVRDVDLVEVAREVYDDLRAAFPDRALTLEVAEGIDARVDGDPAGLHQAVLNLGANACTHTERQTPVGLCVAGPGSFVEVCVIDHGPGIDEAEAQQIFLPFYRTDPSRVRHGASGAGLGLAITHQVARDHGGSVGLEPTPGGGATFTLRIPRAG